MNLTDQIVSGTDEISIENSLNAATLGLNVKITSASVVPEGNDLVVYVDNKSKSLPSEDRKQYVFNLSEPLKVVGNVSDELIQAVEFKNNEAYLTTYVKRNIVSGIVVSNPVIEKLESVYITLFEGRNYIYTNYSNAQITVIYPKNDDLNRIFLNNVIYNSHKELNDSLSLNDLYFKDAFTKTDDELNIEVDNLNAKCITSKNNKFSLDSEGNLTVNSITTNQGLNADIDNNYVCNLIYPVGSIYMSVNNVNPSSLFGGVWEQLKDRFLLGSGDTYTNCSMGGEESHILSIAEMPSHNHDNSTYGIGGTSTRGGGIWGVIGAAGKDKNPFGGIEYTGGGQAHNNMPPYLVVNMWKRVS